MGKNLSDEEWDKLLEEQFLKEADFIEEALFSGDDWDDDEEETEEEVHAAYNDLVARLRSHGEYREEEDEIEAEAGAETKAETETEKEETAEKETTEKVIPMPERKRRRKSSFRAVRVAGFAFVGVLCVFAASMSSEANRSYFINNVRYLTGIDTRMVLNNDESNELLSSDEYKAVKDIEEKMGIEIPEFFYKPDDFRFVNYDINKISQMVFLEYEYGDVIASLCCIKKDEKGSSMNFSLHGEKIDTIVVPSGPLTVDIFEVRAAGDVCSSYLAQWDWKNVSYQFSGKLEKEEFLKIMKKIRFLP